jgi:beta-glucosidase
MLRALLPGWAICLLAGGICNAAGPSSSYLAEEARVDALLARMTLEQKIRLIAGDAMMSAPGLPALDIPPLRMSDGPMGTRIPPPSTAYAAGIGLAASWDPGLALEIGVQLGRDARSRGVHFLLGPGVNIYRMPLNGRNFEYFGEDPFLASRIAVGYIQGVQSERVSATVKHFVGNNSEYARQSSDSVIDERALREIYLPAFEASTREAHVGAVMSSYNLTNGEHMSQNGYLDREVLKSDWGFDGVLMSDWGSTNDTVAAANAGLDLEMPSGVVMNPATLLPALQSGAVAAGVIDDKVRRLLRVAVRFGWLDTPQLDIDVPRYNEAGRAVTLRAAEEGMVLLRNEHGLLPLDRQRVQTIAFLGPDAFPGNPTAGGSAMVPTFGAVSPLTAVSDYLGAGRRVLYDPGVRTLAQLARSTVFTTTEAGSTRGVTVESFANDHLEGAPASVRVLRTILIQPPRREEADEPEEPQAGESVAPEEILPTTTTVASMRVTGYFTPLTAGKYLVTLQTSNRFRLLIDDRTILDDATILKASRRHVLVELSAGAHKVVIEQFHPAVRQAPDDFLQCGIAREADLVNATAVAMAARADVAIVAVGFSAATEGEGFDREFALPPDQQALIHQVAAANPKTIVVVTSGGSVEASSWLDSVPALIEAWYAGEQGGTALARLLFGDANFSGRLPISWERRLSDNPSAAHYYFGDPATQRIEYAEGIFVGYRGYQKMRTEPLFPFGFGLSYTSFRYDRLKVQPATGPSSGASMPRFDVAFDVINTGPRAGADIAEVYVSDDTHPRVQRPPEELKGFARLELEPGERRRAHVVLDARAFTYYDVESKSWHADAGHYRVLIGRSSADIQLKQELMLPSAIDIPVAQR